MEALGRGHLCLDLLSSTALPSHKNENKYKVTNGAFFFFFSGTLEIVEVAFLVIT